MHFPDRRIVLVRTGALVSIAWLLAVRPAVGWQFRDVTGLADEADTPRVAMAPQNDKPSVESAESPDATSTANEPKTVPDQDEIRPIRFNKIAAGITTADELKERWGEPLKVTDNAGHEVWKYKIQPFRQVDVTLDDQIVVSLLIYLEEPLDPALVAEEMKLDRYTPVPIPDASGKVLGQAYPERAVLFSLSKELEDPKVHRIQLEPITAELFLLRAEYDFSNRCQQALNDLQITIELDPEYGRAHWMHAKVLAKVGQFQSALNAAETAVELAPSSHRFQLTRARLLAINGRHDEALRATKNVLAADGLPAEIHARGECQLGDLIANGPRPQFKEAMDHHLAAIRIAAPMAEESRFAVRRMAKRVLIDAHLGVALDIAQGDFRQKAQVTAKWLDRAQALIEDTVTHEQGDPVLRLKGLRTHLAASAHLNGQLDPTEPMEQAIDVGRQLTAAEEDALHKSRIQWEMGHTFFEAMRVARIRRDYDSAISHAENAIALFEQSAPKRQSTPEQRFIVARLYFLIGAIHAVAKSDHQEAIAWYAKADPLLREDLPTFAKSTAGLHGERFVSMGVSYWETEHHEQAIEATEYGLKIMQQAVKDRYLRAEALAVPYGNLAAMHRHLGNAEKAEEYASLASHADPSHEVKSR